MAIRNILLVIEDADSALARLDTAAALAEQFDAHLAVLVATSLPQFDVGYDGAMAGSFIVDEMERARESVEARAREVDGRLREIGRPAEVRTAARSLAGIAEEVGRQARYADLVVTGRVADEGYAQSVLERALDGALFDGGRPVVLLPPGWTAGFGRSLMIGWDGSRESSRAVALAMPLIEAAGKVAVAVAVRNGGAGREGDEPGADIGAALSRHNGQVTVDRLPTLGKSVSETLLQHAGDLGADLVVMGAYGHARMTEAIFGGVTHEMIRSARLPLLLAH